jgi:hypothetical protein
MAATSSQPDARDIRCATELEVKEVLACLWEMVRDPAFATALVGLLAVNEHEPEREFLDGIE